MQQERIITREQQEGDSSEGSLRPVALDDFIGQKKAKHNLHIFISAAKSRKDVLDHVLLYGPPGLGKTTIAQIIARELGVNFRTTSGPLLTKAGDLAAILTNLQVGDVLFVDEIHRLNAAVEEILYPAMEDYTLDLIIGEGPAARTVRIDLQKFTLIGATTRLGLLSGPLRDRFGIPLRLEFYAIDELQGIINRGAGILGMNMEAKGAIELARRSRGTPRIALRLLRRIRDFAAYTRKDVIDVALVDAALLALEVDASGLDKSDHRYLQFIAENYGNRPVGVETIAAGLSEQRDTIEETIEPYLIQLGFIQRTPRGRQLAPRAFAHLGISVPSYAAFQENFLEPE